MSNSSLATVHLWSPNHYNGRIYPITKITIHHSAGVSTARDILGLFIPASRLASCTYAIGYDGSIGQGVDESDAPWTSSSYDNDNRAITIEVSNSSIGGDWPVSNASMESLIKLCVDICQRNPGIGELNFTGDATGNLTMHKMFTATTCPGPYLESKFSYIAKEVNKRLRAAKYSKPILTLYEKGVINSPEYWEKNKDKVKHLNTLLKKLASTTGNSEVTINKDVKSAIDHLVKHKIIDSPDYWLKNYKKVKYLDALIISAANHVGKAAPKMKSNAEIAKEILNGTCSDSRWSTWGNGQIRIDRLTAAGYDHVAVQKEVNKLF
jgi:hypothetical protein